MQTPFDTFAKGLLDAGLSVACEVTLQEPVQADPMYVDAVVIPRAGAEALLAERGLLGEMARTASSFEPSAKTPTLAHADRCTARVSMLRASRGVPFVLWMISPGVPRAVIVAWGLRRKARWGAGVYVGSTARVPRVVVLSELPRTRETLLLRLMGRDRVLREALVDFHALPLDAWERGFVPRLLLQVRDDLHRMGADEPESEELRMRYAEIVENTDRMLANARAEGERRGEARGEARGETHGRAEALREAVLAMCEVLDIAVDDARRDTIARADGEALAAMLDALRHTRALP